MTTYNNLPTDLTANIFTYLRQERRQPPHAIAIQNMIDYIEDGVEIYDEEREQINVHERVWCTYAHIKTDMGEDESLFQYHPGMCTIWEEWAHGAMPSGDYRESHVSYKLSKQWFVDIIEARYNPDEQAQWVDEPLEEMYHGDTPPENICVCIGGWSGRGIEV